MPAGHPITLLTWDDATALIVDGVPVAVFRERAEAEYWLPLVRLRHAGVEVRLVKAEPSVRAAPAE